MLRSLDDAIRFARSADGESVALFVVDWRELVARLDVAGLWDADRLDAWLRAHPAPSAELGPLLRVRHASEAMMRLWKVEDLPALDAAHGRALRAAGYPSADVVRAFCRDDRAELTPVCASADAHALWLHRPTRVAPYAVTLFICIDQIEIDHELRRSEARYRAIVQDQTDFIVRYRADFVRTFVNDAYAEFFGGKPEDFVGESFLPLVAGEHRVAVVEKHRRLLAREAEVLSDEHLSIRHDGALCWTHWIDRAMFDEGGELIEFQAVGRDVTELKNAERRLAQAQKMEAIGTLAGGLAHDFNNTLTGILGFAELMLQRPDDHDAVLEYAEGIREAAERASELVSSLLHLSRQPPRRLRWCEVSEIVEAAGRLLRATIPPRIELHIELAKLPPIQADAGQLTQALINLGLNARDAITGHGTIEIGAAIERSEGREEIVLWVSDDGVGIPEHDRARLFEPFFTTKQESDGTGLGLAMVYASARAHGGRVELDSELGRGTSFEIRLPMASSAAQPEAEAEHPRGDGELILLVDDDPVARLHGRITLQHDGYLVLSASSKHDALARHGDRIDEIDALVTDLVMPDGSGRELVRTLHTRRPELPVVLMTAGLAEHRNGEFDAVLEKPLSADELRRSVRAVLAGRPERS